MKSKLFRWLLLGVGLALVGGCQNTMDTGDIVNLRDSYAYIPPGSGFYDPWYGGTGAYFGTGYHGGASVGVGISIPVGGSDD